MPSDSGTIDACCCEGIARLRVRGRAQAFQCPSLRQFVEDSLAGDATEVRIDLSECEHFDSTFLGTLLHLRRTRCATGGAILTLVNPSGECRQLLKRMGATRLFNFASTRDDEPQFDWAALGELESEACGYDFKRNVVTAHQELAEVDGPMQEQYRVIAQMAADDLASAQGK